MVAVAANADEALELAPQHQPDVVLMDIDMPGTICFEAASALMQQHPGMQVIFLSAFFHDRYIEKALQIKARG